MAKWRDDKLNGPLYDTARQPGIQFTPYLPSDDLQFFVERYWTIRWDLRGQPPYHIEHLPDPSIHLVIEDDISGIFGAARGKFSRLIEGQGRAFCIKFRPGAFYPFVTSPLPRRANQIAGLHEVFGAAGHALKMAIRAVADEEERIEIAENFLRNLRPKRDESLALIHQIVDGIVADRANTKTYDLEHQFNLTTRTLQRLFSRYVGVSPSWIIRRYRLHDAVDQLDQGKIVDWPALAADLGYFDQAHFIKDFKKTIGVSPGEYVRRVNQGENS
jgi:AraC-like DNA-binding protein